MQHMPLLVDSMHQVLMQRLHVLEAYCMCFAALRFCAASQILAVFSNNLPLCSACLCQPDALPRYAHRAVAHLLSVMRWLPSSRRVTCAASALHRYSVQVPACSMIHSCNDSLAPVPFACLSIKLVLPAEVRLC